MMKMLYLVRHAKSSWKDMTLSDQQRPLNKRGHRTAPMMGLRLLDRDVHIQQIVASPALRARTTAGYLADAIGYPHQAIRIDEQLYFEGFRGMLDLIHSTKSEIMSLMLVAHNPDMTQLFNFLCGFQTANIPTCGIACIRCPDEWSAVSQGCGQVEFYDYPKKD